MCGIGGIRVGSKDLGERMGNALEHRGPDFHGLFYDETFTLVHRLLSIRSDATRSHQPWTEDECPWVLVFNGQIYNTAEIKKLLPATYAQEELDTALLYALIKKEGWKFIAHIQGMFAIGLYNTDEKTLRLYRDQSGQKNIYYTHLLPQFAFCSEIKGILETVSVPRIADTDAVVVATSIGYMPGDRTLFSHIRKVRPGEIVTVTHAGDVVREQYVSHSYSLEELTPAEAITHTVREHLASKQRVALNLSGGMDSSALLHEMKTLGHSLHTYTTRFENSDPKLNIDADLAKKLATEYGTEHTEILITSALYRDNFVRACELIEEPNYNISLATYLEVAKAEGIHGDKNRVVLSGDGGDEVFGGYPEYQKNLRNRDIMRSISPFLFNHYKQMREGVYWDYTRPIEQWLRIKFFFMGDTSRRLVTERYLEENIPLWWHERTPDPVRDMMYLDRLFWLAGENFIRSDKLYMSESLELRSPLAYQPLRDYFDSRLTHKDYFQGKTNKAFFRNLYINKLPAYITERPDKTGWRSPIKMWWDSAYKDLFIDAFRSVPQGSIIEWGTLVSEVEKKEGWPGKYFHLYFSLAILSKKYNLPL